MGTPETLIWTEPPYWKYATSEGGERVSTLESDSALASRISSLCRRWAAWLLAAKACKRVLELVGAQFSWSMGLWGLTAWGWQCRAGLLSMGGMKRRRGCKNVLASWYTRATCHNNAHHIAARMGRGSIPFSLRGLKHPWLNSCRTTPKSSNLSCQGRNTGTLSSTSRR